MTFEAKINLFCSFMTACFIEEQQNQVEGVDSGFKPTMSQVRKSWGFRRTTIARREFIEEVGDLTYSPPLVRRSRSQRTSQLPETSAEALTTKKSSRTARSVLEDLQWSAPSSPVSEDSKPASEASTSAVFDPSLWQDFGSAFHTAFSLLGGGESLPIMTDVLAVPDILEATAPETINQTEIPDTIEDMEITQPPASENVADEENSDVVLISSPEEDNNEMTLLHITEQLASISRQANLRTQGGKGGRGKAKGRGRGRGRGRGKGKGRGRGRGRAVLESNIADDDSEDEVMLINPEVQECLQEEENDPNIPPEATVLPAHLEMSLNSSQQSDCIILDSDFNQSVTITRGQFDDAPVQMEGVHERNDCENTGECPTISATEEFESSIFCCICHLTQNKRYKLISGTSIS